MQESDELFKAQERLVFLILEKEKRTKELKIANKELIFQNIENKKRSVELKLANKELVFQNIEKSKRAAELNLANKELDFQNMEKGKRAFELLVANKELAFQTTEKANRANELKIANIELEFQKGEKIKRAKELFSANKKLAKYNEENEKRVNEKRLDIYARNLIEASLDPLFTLNSEGKITDMNNASLEITSKTRSEMLNTSFFNYFTNPIKAKEGIDQIYDKGFVSDLPLTIKDHKLTDILFNGSIYKDENGEVLGLLVTARDVTEMKNKEKELIESKIFAEMATTIAEIAKNKAEEATIVAESAVKAKQQFLSNMSHEIRTPMNAIIGFTKVLLKTELNGKQKDYLDAIKLSGDALIVLINDILDLAKVDAGKMMFEEIPFRLSASLTSMLNLFDLKIQEKNLTLIKDFDQNIPDVLVGDSLRLNQIILNLVSNAVKFTNTGEITIVSKLIAETDNDVEILFSVADTGIGISEDNMEKIFENFQQAYSGSTRLYGGTGLGLAIVKQLVESQGGKVNIISKVNQGSTFSFNLKFKKTNENIELNLSEDTAIEENNSNINILIVEDVPLNQLLMKTILDDFGFTNDFASNGKIAIEKMHAVNYDIILMDLQMPIMNGFETTEYIRKTLNSKVPIIALTADVTTVDITKCMSVGMNEYISKPVDEKILYSKILNLVNKNKSKPLVDNNSNPEKCIDLEYLISKTKSNPQLMSEMISLYLEQTPPLVKIMKTSLQEKDWSMLHSTIHKLIPSFSIIGINSDFESIARKIQDYASSQKYSDSIIEMVNQIERILIQSCDELTVELNKIKK